MSAFPDRWAVLRVRFPVRSCSCSLRNSEGQRLRRHWEGRLAWPIPRRFLWRPHPQSRGDAARVPSRTAQHRAHPFALFRRRSPLSLAESPHGRIPHAAGQRHLPRPGADGGARGAVASTTAAFTLPFRIVGFGDQAKAAIGSLAQRWLGAESVGPRGRVRDRPRDLPRPRCRRTCVAAVTRDIVVTDNVEIATGLAGSLPADDRPRLILSMDSRTVASAPPFPGGAALVAFIAPVFSAVRSVLYGLVHDLPIHQAVKAARRTNQTEAYVFAELSGTRGCACATR